MRPVVLMAVAIAILLLTDSTSADIPQIINYQGKVIDTAGTSIADGDYVMRFQIYDASSGGSPLWDSGARLVSVNSGIFNVLLGQKPPGFHRSCL